MKEVVIGMRIFAWDEMAGRFMKACGIKNTNAIGFCLVYKKQEDLDEDFPPQTDMINSIKVRVTRGEENLPEGKE